MDIVFQSLILPSLSGLLVAAATLGCFYLLAACALVLRGAGVRRPAPGRAVPVSILKPLHGAEPGLFTRLASFCRQDYAAPVQLVCGAQDWSDPAVAIVRKLQETLPDHDIALKVDARAHGSNRKISNVSNMAALARHDVLVLSDSDIEVGPDYLAAMAGELQKPGIGAVTCLYHGIGEVGIWSRLSALAINTHFLPNVITALNCRLARPCFGSTIALRRETLAEIGGFQAYADCLADDYEIGNAVRATGRAVSIPSFTVGHACSQRSLRQLFLDELRYARTIKTIDPAGYAGAVITHPLPLALLALMLGSPHAWLVVPLALACRIVLGRCIEHAFGLKHQQIWLLPLRDCLSFAVFVTSFFGAAVSWRGYKYHVLAGGALVQDPN
jgi:ceramide glucosyltransferase